MNEWQPSEFNLEEALAMTSLMRSSPNPQWRELRERLSAAGVALDEAVLTEWVTEGDVNMGATVATRGGRMFGVMIVMGYNRDRQRVPDDEGHIISFREVAAEKITTVDRGYPNSWLQAAMIARIILDGPPVRRHLEISPN